MQVEDVCQYNILNNKSQVFEEDNWPTELKNDIKVIIIKEELRNYDVKVKKLPANGGNYLADLYEIDIAGVTAKGDKEINLFIKQLHLGTGCFQDMLNVQEVYKTEKFAYKEVHQVFDELQEAAKVPIEERYKMAKYYDSNPGAIVMDNLRKRGYSMTCRTDTVCLDYAKLAIENLAKFHGLSFAMEKLKPDFFDSKINTMKCPFIMGDVWQSFLKSIFSISMSNLEGNLRNRVEDIIFSKLDKFQKYYESSEVSCLCHGDYRVMNTMVRNVDGKIKDLIALDYQLLNYGNPLTDFFYFVFTATDRKFRKSHLSYLKDLYYKTVKNFLEYFAMDIEDIFPRDIFERIYEETMEFGLITMVIFGPFMYADEGDVPDLANVAMSSLDFKVDSVYKDLLRDVIEDFIEWGYL